MLANRRNSLKQKIERENMERGRLGPENLPTQDETRNPKLEFRSNAQTSNGLTGSPFWAFPLEQSDLVSDLKARPRLLRRLRYGASDFEIALAHEGFQT